MSDYQAVYKIFNLQNEAKILGPENSFLKAIEERLGLDIIVRQGEVLISTDKLEYQKEIENVFTVLERIFEKVLDISLPDLTVILNNLGTSSPETLIKLYLDKTILFTTNNGRVIYPRTLNQKIYIKSLVDNDITFSVGPAGTGKTFLAVLFSINRLRANQAKKIILVRPVVEAGEKLGFLPGDLKDKIDPYLIPLYDGLNESLGKEKVDKMIEKGIIEVAPLAYMRGRTLENAVIILDEAQNATLLQMKMFLTRLGYNSKMIITGDITQVDLPNKNSSGLIEAISLLEGIKNIAIVRFEKNDIMRHPLVYKIIERYESKK
ncbi:MAG TPA: PhoH family protein [Bacilli bacterium]|nr:PhoH family protein [Bacilli bacterium]